VAVLLRFLYQNIIMYASLNAENNYDCESFDMALFDELKITDRIKQE